MVVKKKFNTVETVEPKQYKWGEITPEGKKIYPLHDAQKEVLGSGARFTAAVAGTGGGKTVLGPLWLAKRIKKLVSSGMTKGLIGMVIAPTYKVLSRATIPTLIETFRGTKLEGKYLETKGIYQLPRGMGLIYLLSADNPDGLEGGQLNIGAWLDEAGQMTHKAWFAICRRTGVNQAPIFITTTPYTQNWLKYDVVKRYTEGDPNYFVKMWASISNPAYPLDEYNRAKGSMSAQSFEMMYNGQFTMLEGLVFPDLGACVYDDTGIIRPRGRLVGGIDFGWRDPFCAIGADWYIDEETKRDVLDIYFERYKSKIPLEDHAKALVKGTVWYADPSEPEGIKYLNGQKIAVLKGKNPISLGISAVNERIMTKRLKISSKCQNLIIEAENYQYPEGNTSEEPMEGMDHAMAALRYLCLSIKRTKVEYKNGQTVIA